MDLRISALSTFVQKAFSLARPYGRKKLSFIFGVILLQGLFQVIGVTSIFPFLAVASNPQVFRDSGIGKQILEWIPPVTNEQLLILAGIFAIGMLLSSNALMLLGEVVRARYTQGFGHWLRVRLLNRMISNPYSYFLQRNTGELLKKTSGDVMTYVNNVLAPLMEVIARAITVGFLLLTLLLVNPILAILTSLGFGLFYWSFFKILKHRRRATSDALKIANRGAMKEAQQLLGGIKPVKVHGVEREFLDRYSHHSFVQAILQKWFPVYQNSPRYLVEPLAFGGIVVVVLVFTAKGENLTDVLPMLGVMAVAGYRLIPNFQLLYGLCTGMSLMMHSLEEVYDEFNKEEKTEYTPERAQEYSQLAWNKSLELRSLTFRYPNSKDAVIKDINLTIPKNNFVAFIGETGSGKSTLIDLILGLHSPQHGGIYLDDEALTPDNMRNWRAGIGYVPQEIFLLDDTLACNIAFGKDKKNIDMDRVRLVAKVAQISNFIEEEITEGYDSEVGERGVRLSGGQRQRIGLARALYHNPSLLILDEATSALDVTTEAALMEAIENLYGQITMIVIAHRLTTVRKADTIFRLKHGKVVESGTYSELNLDAN